MPRRKKHPKLESAYADLFGMVIEIPAEQMPKLLGKIFPTVPSLQTLRYGDTVEGRIQVRALAWH
jgi:hypothetical protein